MVHTWIVNNYARMEMEESSYEKNKTDETHLEQTIRFRIVVNGSHERL
jgi:hypothetical protein